MYSAKLDTFFDHILKKKDVFLRKRMYQSKLKSPQVNKNLYISPYISLKKAINLQLQLASSERRNHIKITDAFVPTKDLCTDHVYFVFCFCFSFICNCKYGR